jgi:hypothetical protein
MKIPSEHLTKSLEEDAEEEEQEEEDETCRGAFFVSSESIVRSQLVRLTLR